MNKHICFVLLNSLLLFSFANGQRPLPKDLDSKVQALGVPQPICQWDFSKGTNDLINNLPGHLIGEATIENGRLCLPSEGSYYKTDPLPFKISEKTMIAQVCLNNLDQRGGGLITVESLNGVTFDSIVFGEGKAKVWNNGSEFGIRIRGVQGVEESAHPETSIWMAITYHKDGKISLYKNGNLYKSTFDPGIPLQHFQKKKADILFGKRHEGGGHPYLQCKIDFAQLYNVALDDEQIKNLYIDRAK